MRKFASASMTATIRYFHHAVYGMKGDREQHVELGFVLHESGNHEEGQDDVVPEVLGERQIHLGITLRFVKTTFWFASSCVKMLVKAMDTEINYPSLRAPTHHLSDDKRRHLLSATRRNHSN